MIFQSMRFGNISRMPRKTPSFAGFSPSSPASSRAMRGNRKRDTKPEMLLRRALWRAGYRYRLHVSGLPGRPDLVFPRARVAVFCDGDFWHGRDWLVLREKLERRANPGYWIPKIEMNIRRDRQQEADLACCCALKFDQISGVMRTEN
ncbi:MAG: very short patch repair endonuclease [Gammaproteobacteria bacterium]|nr:very short patch repair endonuclease [Gammaproteobacteria bacterium]